MCRNTVDKEVQTHVSSQERLVKMTCVGLLTFCLVRAWQSGCPKMIAKVDVIVFSDNSRYQ